MINQLIKSVLAVVFLYHSYYFIKKTYIKSKENPVNKKKMWNHDLVIWLLIL